MKSRRKFISLIATILSVFMVATLFSACSNEAPSTESEVKVKEQAQAQAEDDKEKLDDYESAFDDVADDSDVDLSDIKTYDSDDVGNNIIEFEAETISTIEIETYTYEWKVIEFEPADIDLDFSFDNPILNDDGSVDKAASRRVVFRIIGK